MTKSATPTNDDEIVFEWNIRPYLPKRWLETIRSIFLKSKDAGFTPKQAALMIHIKLLDTNSWATFDELVSLAESVYGEG